MNCLRCELARARIKAAALHIVGWTPQQIADKLSKDYGELYFVDDRMQSIFRANKLPPYQPYSILNKD